MGDFQDKIVHFSKRKRNRIGIPIIHDTEEIRQHLKIASEHSDVIVFGKKIDNYECFEVDMNENNLDDQSDRISSVTTRQIGSDTQFGNEQKVARELFKAYDDGKIDGFIRGQLKYDQFYDEMERTLGKKYEDIVPIMKTHIGNEFAVAPGVMTYGHTNKERLELALKAAQYFQRFGIALNFGVLGGDFLEDRGHHEAVDKTIDDAVELVKLLKENGQQADYFAHRIEKAIYESNFIIPINGIYGNLIYRLLIYHGSAEELGEAVICNEAIGENSRYTNRLSNNLIFANAVVNMLGSA